MKHKISDLKIGDQIIIINEGGWVGHPNVGKVGKIISIESGRAFTDIKNPYSTLCFFVDDSRYPFRLAPNCI